jgi:hypothetical protein
MEGFGACGSEMSRKSPVEQAHESVRIKTESKHVTQNTGISKSYDFGGIESARV